MESHSGMATPTGRLARSSRVRPVYKDREREGERGGGGEGEREIGEVPIKEDVPYLQPPSPRPLAGEGSLSSPTVCEK